MRRSMRGLMVFVAIGGWIGCNSPPSSPSDGGAGDAAEGDASLGDAPLADASAVDAEVTIDAQAADAGCPTPTDFESDPLNCGSCGHDCFGGTCTAGECGPVEIVTGVYAIDLEVDGGYVYWIENGTHTLWRRIKDASAPAVMLASSSNMMGLAVDATHVYFGTYTTAPFGGEMWRIVKDGSALKEYLGSFPGAAPNKIALDATRLYVATWSGVLAMAGVHSFLKTGGAYIPIVTGVSCVEVRVDATDVYFSGDSPDGVMPHTVSKTPKAGGGPVTLLTSGPPNSYPFSLGLGGGFLYVGWYGPIPGGSLDRISLATGVITSVTTGASVRDVAADAAGAAWGTGEAKVWKVSHLDVGGTELAADLSYVVWNVAMDSDSVYWASLPPAATTPGNIYRIAR